MTPATVRGLVHGRVTYPSRRTIVDLVDRLWEDRTEGAVLGCTELETLVEQADADVPLFPVTALHVQAALDRALVE